VPLARTCRRARTPTSACRAPARSEGAPLLTLDAIWRASAWRPRGPEEAWSACATFMRSRWPEWTTGLPACWRCWTSVGVLDETLVVVSSDHRRELSAENVLLRLGLDGTRVPRLDERPDGTCRSWPAARAPRSSPGLVQPRRTCRARWRALRASGIPGAPTSAQASRFAEFDPPTGPGGRAAPTGVAGGLVASARRACAS
jgi:hypothetical protein